MRMIVLALALTGCATTWHKPGAGQRDFQIDAGQCQAQAGSISNPQPMQHGFVYRACMEGKGWVRH